jgi:MSHA biogenesis protein MshN
VLLAALGGSGAALAVRAALRMHAARDAVLELSEPARVGAGAAAAAADASTSGQAHRGARRAEGERRTGPRVEALWLDRDASGTRLRLQLDSPADHRMQVTDSGREVSVVLRGARVDRPLARVDLAGTEIAWLDLRPEPPDLRVVLGLTEARRVSSASYRGERGATLVVDLLRDPAAEDASDPPPAASDPSEDLEDPEDLIPDAGPVAVKRPAPPPDTEAQFAAALEMERSGRIDAARAAHLAVLAAEPAHVAARLRLARLETARGNRGEALRLLREGRALDPASAALAALEARLLADQGDVDAALALLDPLASRERDADFHALHGALLARAGLHARAVDAFGAALEREPARGAAWLGLAISLDAERRAPEARAAFERALALGGIEPAARAWAEERAARLRGAR